MASTQTLKPLRIGIVGAGANTQARHIPGLRAMPGVTVAALCNRTRASSEQAAAKLGVPKVVDHWRELVEAPDLDAIVIGTWPYLHAEITQAALAAGKHVLTEARMARTLAEAEAMLAASQARPDLVAQIVPAPMSLDFDATIQGMLADGTLGALREVRVTHTNAAVAAEQTPATWRQNVELSGFNTMALGIYYEMVLRWLRSEPETLVADAAVFTRERTDTDGKKVSVPIPDSVSVLARYRTGTRLIAHFSGVERGTSANEIRLNGSRASLRLDFNRKELWLSGEGGTETMFTVPVELRRGWRVEEDFIHSIRTGEPVRLTDFASGVNYMRFTEAVWRGWSGFEKKATIVGDPAR